MKIPDWVISDEIEAHRDYRNEWTRQSAPKQSTVIRFRIPQRRSIRLTPPEGIGDVIFGEPFLKEVGINAKWFEGMITIYNGNDEVTYQMARLHPRFKHYTNEQCNKIPPLLKDPITFEMRRWKSGSHAGTLACMRWNSDEKLKKSLT
ncbi:hypothetical protein Tco_0715862 [Tanacetum coccineum]